jgi:uncharacterized protein (DUF983 family)
MKGTKLYSIFTFTCPRCHEGRLFKGPAYSSKLMEMHRVCPHCGEDLAREPGFYFGAAYVSYALTVALWVALLVALYTFDAIGLIHFSMESHWVGFMVGGIALLILLLPVLYRLSRAIWINLFVKYRSDAVEWNRALRATK